MPQIIRIKGGRPQAKPPREFMGFKLGPNDLYNGKPLDHWLAMADEMVMSTIVRGIYDDKNSLVQTIATERLRGLAMALNPGLFYKTIEERNRCRAGISQVVGSMLGWEDPAGHAPKAYCPKHAPKAKQKAKPRKRK